MWYYPQTKDMKIILWELSSGLHFSPVATNRNPSFYLIVKGVKLKCKNIKIRKRNKRKTKNSHFHGLLLNLLIHFFVRLLKYCNLHYFVNFICIFLLKVVGWMNLLHLNFTRIICVGITFSAMTLNCRNYLKGWSYWAFNLELWSDINLRLCKNLS